MQDVQKPGGLPSVSGTVTPAARVADRGDVSGNPSASSLATDTAAQTSLLAKAVLALIDDVDKQLEVNENQLALNEKLIAALEEWKEFHLWIERHMRVEHSSRAYRTYRDERTRL